MQQNGDLYVLPIVIVGIAVFLYIIFKRWLNTAPRRTLPLPDQDEKPEGEAVAFLEQAGYEVQSGKFKVDIAIRLNDQEELLHSRLFIDYVASMDNQLYVVKIANDRKPLDFTGSGIRERLLVYHMLYEQAAGVLYVDMKEQQIHKIIFELEA